MRLLFVFIVWPLVEIGLFVTIGGMVGLWATLAWVVGTGLLGAAVLRRMGQIGRQMVGRPIAGSDFLSPVANQMLLVVAGVLLVLPGFLTDAIGMLLLLPFVRYGIVLLARRWVSRMVAPGTQDTGPVTIDGDYTVWPDPSHPEPSQPAKGGQLSGWATPDERGPR